MITPGVNAFNVPYVLQGPSRIALAGVTPERFSLFGTPGSGKWLPTEAVGPLPA